MKKRHLLAIIATAMISAGASAEGGQSWYVSPDGDNITNDGSTPEAPFRSLEKGVDALAPGDTLFLLPGIYTEKHSSGRDLMEIRRSGEPGKLITVKAYDPTNRPVLYVSAEQNGVWDMIAITGSHIVVEGLELKGANADLDSVAAWQNAYNHKYNKDAISWANTARFNTNGITVGPINNDGSLPTHVTIRNCVVHDCPGGGLNCTRSDYVTFEDNLVYNNAWFCMYACSGISFMHSYNSDDNTTDFKQIIRRNTLFNNHTKIPWYTTGDFRHSDGNGIIIDIHNNPPADLPGGAYKGKILVENNLCYFNGGSGIHTFRTSNVTVINNTAWHNSQRYSKDYAEIWCNQGTNSRFANNIMVARDNGSCNFNADYTVKFVNNVYHNGSVGTRGSNCLTVDPMFVDAAPRLDADFHLSPESPAIGHGVVGDYAPTDDHDGNPRKDAIDAGAFQTTATGGIETVYASPQSNSGVVNTTVKPGCYDLSGRRIANAIDALPSHGIFIEVNENGTSTKVAK